ncbi:MAG TPA: hypothetical protein VFE16_05650 [Candidatus Cybelea sp.]|jgi:hypothetical protein|nr:hypothetical protein [Candidatus Cybelea sp.]
MLRVLAIAAVSAALTLRAATAAEQCTQESLSVEGRAVSIGYCISGPLRSNGADEVLVPVTATYAASGTTLRLPIQLHFIAGENVSRVLESLDLTKLGLTGTLHLTLAFAHGLVRVEGALLTPGAITIK